MLFHAQEFLLGFLPACLAGFFALGRWAGPAWALRWLVAASLFFYGWWNPSCLPLLAGSILGNWLFGRRIATHGAAGRATAARTWLFAGIALNLAVLGWFKYAGFALSILAPSAIPPDIVLPLAISFFTFQQIMFLSDSARTGRSAPLLPYAAFVAFFPHLIAGPLVRPAEVLPQLQTPRMVVPDHDNLTAGLTIFLLGLGKKLILADLFGRFADVGFDAAANGAALSFFEAWYALLAYALQIYFDFSGYSDMAIGLARMLNVRFPLNFDSPYQARDITAFWRRWHITLGAFLRDFVYIPLGGSRHGTPRRLLALLTTMLLCGLWHGAAWRFVLWGGLHGAALAAHVLHRRFLHRRFLPPPPPLLAWPLTLLIVIVAWVPFRAADLSTAWRFLLALGGANGLALPRMIFDAVPLAHLFATPVPVLPWLGDARTLSFPEVTACLIIGWTIVLVLPNLHRWGEAWRVRALTGSFALTVQAIFFAPHVAPFLYFRF